MLAQTIRNNLKDINNLTMRRKTTKFSNLFQTQPTEGEKEPDFVKVLAKSGILEIPKEEALAEYSKTVEPELALEIEPKNIDDPYEFVENPKEAIVNFPIISDIICEEKLPFFKTLSLKLANL